MVHSLGLTLYNLGGRASSDASLVRPARAKGRLVWLHAPAADSAVPLLCLARRLRDEDGLAVLLTCPDPLPPQFQAEPGVVLQPPPHDSPAAARAFLDHWHPEIAVFTEGELRPAVLHEAQERGMPAVMLDGLNPYILRGREGWWPGLMRSLLGSFRAVLTVDQSAARAFRRAGAQPGAVQAIGRMEHPSAALPCTEAERAALARLLSTRPVWFAAALPQAEETLVIEAHRSALRLAHRLLLIVAPQDSARATPFAERMEQIEGWVVARRSEDEEPDPDVQVYVADSASEFGLWYRLAPITYLGGSLSSTGCARDPLEPAALGSSIIHGPKAGRFGPSIGRLAGAQATALVGSSADLAQTLGELLSPDRAARLAQAAWAIASDGAEATEQALVVIRGLMTGSR